MSGIRIEAEAKKLGFALKRVPVGDRMKTHWTCTCAQCGKLKVWAWEPATSPHFMVQNATNAGWKVEKRGITCDECVMEEQNTRRKVSKIEPMNPKLQRKVFALLDDHFDEDKRLYRDNWCDKKIAEAADTSEQFVATLRKGAYGELAEDPAITALKVEMAELEKVAKMIEDDLLNRMAEISQKVTALYARINNLETKRVA